MEINQIRDNSIKSAKQFGVDVLPTLPLLESGLVMRSVDEIVSRILAMSAVAAVAYGFDKTRAIAWLKQEGLTDSLSGQEKCFIFDGAGQPERFKTQVEGMWALAWAAGIVNEFTFSKDCDSRFVLILPNMKQNQSSDEFRKRINPRRIDQVVGACDLAYCLHWAIRESEIHGKRPPVGLKAYRIVERRRAFDWLLSKNQWDETGLDT